MIVFWSSFEVFIRQGLVCEPGTVCLPFSINKDDIMTMAACGILTEFISHRSPVSKPSAINQKITSEGIN